MHGRGVRSMPNRRRAVPGGRNNTARRAAAWTRWHEYAACVGQPSGLFYGRESETAAERVAREQTALAVCERCPVRRQCRAHAMTLPETYGVWGGTTEAHRRKSRHWSKGQPFDTSGRAS
ncbi:WhiB family transcriptional regulator [Actinopolymorpha singaporensis]